MKTTKKGIKALQEKAKSNGWKKGKDIFYYLNKREYEDYLKG